MLPKVLLTAKSLGNVGPVSRPASASRAPSEAPPAASYVTEHSTSKGSLSINLAPQVWASNSRIGNMPPALLDSGTALDRGPVPALQVCPLA